MKKILLIGASGQLGTRIFRKLTDAGYPNIRILVRDDSHYQHLLPDQPEVFVGDLRDVKSLIPALKGVHTVITTPSSAVPRKKTDTIKKVDTKGYIELIDEAKRLGIEHFIFTSVKPMSAAMEHWLPLAKAKRVVEKHLINSGLKYTIFQPDAFMDVYFTFMGTSLPTLDDEAPLVNRDFNFVKTFYNSIKDDVDQGRIGLIGTGKVRHSYITAENVAEFIAKAVDEPGLMNKIIPLGGPEALSFLDVKANFEKVLARDLKIKRIPLWVIKSLGNIMAPFFPNAANIMKLNYLHAVEESIIDSSELAQRLGIRLTTAEEFLKKKRSYKSSSVNNLSTKKPERMAT